MLTNAKIPVPNANLIEPNVLVGVKIDEVVTPNEAIVNNLLRNNLLFDFLYSSFV